MSKLELLPYPAISILEREEQLDKNAVLKGVDRYRSEQNTIDISIPIEYRKKVERFRPVVTDTVYMMWIVNGIVHEDMHWVLNRTGIEEQDSVHLYSELIEPYGESDIFRTVRRGIYECRS